MYLCFVSTMTCYQAMYILKNHGGKDQLSVVIVICDSIKSNGLTLLFKYKVTNAHIVGTVDACLCSSSHSHMQQHWISLC